MLTLWMKPYIEIWDYDLLEAWKQHPLDVLHASIMEIYHESKNKEGFCHSSLM
jgi:hypothetical protein